MRLFHYTVADRLPAIQDSGAIRPATGLVPPGEKPVVWCSFNQDWEETANKAYLEDLGLPTFGTKQTTHEKGGGLARIEVDPASCPLDWKLFKKQSGVRPCVARGLYNSALAFRAKPSQWRASFDPIGREYWLAIEFFSGELWESSSPTDALLGRVA